MGGRSRLVPGERLQQRHPRLDARALRARGHRHHPPQRPQIHAGRAHLHRRRPGVHGAGDRPCVGHPAQRDPGRRATRSRRAPAGQGHRRDLSHVQRVRRRPAGDREACSRGRRAVRHGPGLGAAPPLLQPPARRCHERRRRRRRGEHPQAHQRHHPDLRPHGARSAREHGQAGRHGPAHPDHESPGAHVRQHRCGPTADGDAGRTPVERRSGAGGPGARAARSHPRGPVPGTGDAGAGRRGRVRPHASHHLHLRSRPHGVPAGEPAARRLPRGGGGRRPAQHRAQRHLRGQRSRPRRGGGGLPGHRGAVRGAACWPERRPSPGRS